MLMSSFVITHLHQTHYRAVSLTYISLEMALSSHHQLRYEDMKFVHIFGTYAFLPLMIFVFVGCVFVKLKYGDISERMERKTKRSTRISSSGFWPKKYGGPMNAIQHRRVSKTDKY